MVLNRRILFLAGGVLLLRGISIPLWGQDSETCLVCHGDASLKEDAATQRQYVDPDLLSQSVHGIFSCVDCHKDLVDVDPYAHDSNLAPADCASCHEDIDLVFRSSLHAYASIRGNERAPGCADCHGAHDILSSDETTAKTHRKNIPTMCGQCHGTAGLLTDQLIRLPQVAAGYARSVHGQAFKRGIDTAAVCSDCHGSHDMKGILDPGSKINPLNVSTTCGSCHTEVGQQYARSIHGRALAAGIMDSPTCNTCHGEHAVLSPDDPEAATSPSHLALETCGECHNNPRINEKYGLAGYVVETYEDSYHGWAVRRNSPDAATCIRCHTAHWVLPARDPASTVSTENVVETCRQCHPQADQRFAASYTHLSAATDPVKSLIELIYMVLIPVVIGGMALHNLVILGYYLGEKRRREKNSVQVLRLDGHQVTQHILLAVSFTILVVTGFALRFPEAWWVRYLSDLGMTEGARSVLHRIAAIVLLATGAVHLLYVMMARRGRREFAALVPRYSDFVDFLQNMLFYVRKRPEPVRFGRYDYTQKAEYWALVWGTVIMGLTGLVLWYPETAVRFFPSWIVEASQALHYYEAWLATLAILVWHFFFVIFHPDAYPMSWTWITGKMTRHEVEHHHGRWYDEEFGDSGKG